MPNTRLLMGAMVLAALGAGAAACTPSGASPAGPGPASPGMSTSPTLGAAAGTGAGTGSGAGSAITTASGAASQGIMTGPGAYLLGSMPAGTVTVSRAGQGHLQANVRLFGLTPGSSHTVAIDALDGAGPAVAQFPALTAGATGQVDTVVTSAGRVAALPRFSRFVIRLGGDGSALAAEPIAESGVLPGHLGSTSDFHAVTENDAGTVAGQPRGRAVLSYDAAAQTLTVTVSATGLNPGPHAAHIHLGSCASQGPVKYMLPDFIADRRGDIDHQTRVVTGVPSVPGPGNWYLNLHMGGMNQILAGGAPTLSFRPLLCTNVTSVAGMQASPAASTAPPSAPGMPSSSAMPGMPASTPMPGMPVSTPMPGTSASTPAMSPSGSPTAVPVSYPTHF